MWGGGNLIYGHQANKKGYVSIYTFWNIRGFLYSSTKNCLKGKIFILGFSFHLFFSTEISLKTHGLCKLYLRREVRKSSTSNHHHPKVLPKVSPPPKKKFSLALCASFLIEFQKTCKYVTSHEHYIHHLRLHKA